jgi:hypothetical protein
MYIYILHGNATTQVISSLTNAYGDKTKTGIDLYRNFTHIFDQIQ